MFIDDGDLVFVHGGLHPRLDLEANDGQDFLWRSHRGGPLHRNGKRVVCGHTAQTDHLPLVTEGAVIADTFAYGGVPLSCISIDERLAYEQLAGGCRRQLQWSETFEFCEIPLSA